MILTWNDFIYVPDIGLQYKRYMLSSNSCGSSHEFFICCCDLWNPFRPKSKFSLNGINFVGDKMNWSHEAFLIFWISFQPENRKSEITFVFENTSDRILAVDSYGRITETEYQDCLKKCRNSSKIIFKFYKDMISKYAIKM